MRQRDNDNVK